MIIFYCQQIKRVSLFILNKFPKCKLIRYVNKILVNILHAKQTSQRAKLLCNVGKYFIMSHIQHLAFLGIGGTTDWCQCGKAIYDIIHYMFLSSHFC
jgi:hypothetical protein